MSLEPPPSQVQLTDDIHRDSIWKLWFNRFYTYILYSSWSEIGSSGKPAFQNSWANNGGGTDETAAYKVNGQRIMLLKGYISGGTTADGTVIFTLPELIRPNNAIRVAGIFVQGSTENVCQLEIQADGDVAIYGVSGASPKISLHCFINLDN